MIRRTCCVGSDTVKDTKWHQVAKDEVARKRHSVTGSGAEPSPTHPCICILQGDVVKLKAPKFWSPCFLGQ